MPHPERRPESYCWHRHVSTQQLRQRIPAHILKEKASLRPIPFLPDFHSKEFAKPDEVGSIKAHKFLQLRSLGRVSGWGLTCGILDSLQNIGGNGPVRNEPELQFSDEDCSPQTVPDFRVALSELA